jgi:hypothetical protein
MPNAGFNDIGELVIATLLIGLRWQVPVGRFTASRPVRMSYGLKLVTA